MEQENKYYTPEIEEFHVGFEYEHYHDAVCDGNQDWYNDTFYFLLGTDRKRDGGHTVWRMEDLKEAIEKEEVRVKHLDREDIESLGFEHSESNKKEVIYYRSCDNQTTDKEVRLWFDKEFGYVEIKNLKDKYNLDYMFRGIIKNKSELKRILKQIGI